MMSLDWYHWAILGLILMVSELAVPAFVFVWFGIGALFVAAAMAWAGYLLRHAGADLDCRLTGDGPAVVQGLQAVSA